MPNLKTMKEKYMKITLILIGIIMGFGLTVIAQERNWFTPNDLQTGKIITVEQGDDIWQIQIWCEVLKSKNNYCVWNKEYKRYRLTCCGLERFYGYGNGVESNYQLNAYKCLDN